MPQAPHSRDSRPDPDELLARVQRDALEIGRGRLRIYFGASAGVGKTYAMLQAGRKLARDGCDVVVGIVETHGRRETEALLEGNATLGPPLAVIPRMWPVDAAGTTAQFGEFDLDAALARKPQFILVDELAHSNAAGGRHAKRWQDVDELLGVGIDVFTTLNVQHLESLNDIVGGITGIKVWETVPDTFFDRADEVILVDIAADELLIRLASGKVYLPDQAEHAARNFFRKGNLMALREIALRRTADRVEDDVQAYREERSIGKVWGTHAALLCCVGPDSGAERVVRSAARLAGQLEAQWFAIFVETPGLQKRSKVEREAILKVLKLAEQLGAATAVLSGNDVVDAVVRYARERNLSRLIIGQGAPIRIFARLLGVFSLADGVALRAPELDLIVIGRPFPAQAVPDVQAFGTPRQVTRRRDEPDDDPTARRKRIELRWRYVHAALACAAVTALTLPWSVLHPTNVAMIYLLAVTVVAMRLGRGPAVFTSLISVAAFDFFFVPPRFSFAVADVQYLLTFGVMLTVALVIGTLASNLRYQAKVSAHREDRARSLYEIARELSKALRSEDIVASCRSAIASLFDAEVHVLLPVRLPETSALQGQLEIDQALGRSAGFEPAIAQWAFERSTPAGAGTDTLSGSPWLFLPLLTSMRARGVLAIRPSRRRLLMIPEQRRFLETLATLIAIAIERVHYVEVAQGAVLRVESERLRNSILSALSHDLRTPIAVMAGLAETLEMRLPREASREEAFEEGELLSAMRDEVQRMSALVENLLDMARIESGDVRLNRQWHSIEETIGTAVAATARMLKHHVIETIVPRNLPLVEYDAVLIERVLVNLLENAAKYTPAGSTVRLEAEAPVGFLQLVVDDDGPGLPARYDTPERVKTLFDKFTRGEQESPRHGVGLGLAICRAIVEAHGGSIDIEARSGSGVRFVISLPRAVPPPVLNEGSMAARQVRPLEYST